MTSNSGPQRQRATEGSAAAGSAAVPQRANRQNEQLGLLTVAIVLACLGFVWRFFWFVALLVLGVLWGYVAAAIRGTRTSGGVGAAAGAVVTQAREIAAEVSAASGGDDAQTPPVSEPEPVSETEHAAEDATKAELYKQAQEADIAGRSNMTKDELRDALEDQ